MTDSLAWAALTIAAGFFLLCLLAPLAGFAAVMVVIVGAVAFPVVEGLATLEARATRRRRA